jgi:hypothetical protein
MQQATSRYSLQRSIPLEMFQQAAPGNNSARLIYLWLSIGSQQGHRAAKAMGRSREPPAFARFGPTSDEMKVARVAGYTPKRLPSRRREQTGLVDDANLFEHEDEHEHEDDWWRVSPPVAAGDVPICLGWSPRKRL